MITMQNLFSMRCGKTESILAYDRAFITCGLMTHHLSFWISVLHLQDDGILRLYFSVNVNVN